MKTLLDLSRDLRRLADGALIDAIGDRLEGLAERGIERAQDNAVSRMTMRTYALFESIGGDVDMRRDAIDLELFAGRSARGVVIHARLQELGTQNLEPTHYLRDAFDVLDARLMGAVLDGVGDAHD